MDQLWSYYWSRTFWLNKTSVTLIMLLIAQTDKLTDKYKEVCHDRHCFGFRNNKNFDRNSSTQFQPGSVHTVYRQRTAVYFSVDAAHNTDCSWKWGKIERYVVTFRLRLPIKAIVWRINAALTHIMRSLNCPIQVSQTGKINKMSISNGKKKNSPWFQTFAVFWILYASFWVIPRRLNFICRRFRTLCLFHLHRRVGMNSPASEFYMPTFRNALSVPSS